MQRPFIAPGALLVPAMSPDTLIRLSGMQAAVDKLTQIYAKLGCPKNRGTFSMTNLMLQAAHAGRSVRW